MSGEENTGFDFFVNYEGEVFLGKWFKRFVLRCSLIKCYCEDARKFWMKTTKIAKRRLKNVSEIANVFKRK